MEQNRTPLASRRATRIALSIDADLLRQADQEARRMGLSRSRFLEMAISDFLEQRRPEEMLRRLNEVYAGGREPAEGVLKGIKTKSRRTVKDRW
jgi:predicted transcriptional regulator